MVVVSVTVSDGGVHPLQACKAWHLVEMEGYSVPAAVRYCFCQNGPTRSAAGWPRGKSHHAPDIFEAQGPPPYNTKPRIKGGGLRRPRWDRTLPLFSIIIEGSV